MGWKKEKSACTSHTYIRIEVPSNELQNLKYGWYPSGAERPILIPSLSLSGQRALVKIWRQSLTDSILHLICVVLFYWAPFQILPSITHRFDTSPALLILLVSGFCINWYVGTLRAVTPHALRARVMINRILLQTRIPVSYTHLTLPTKA